MFAGGTPVPLVSALPSPHWIVHLPDVLCDASKVIACGAYPTMGSPVSHAVRGVPAAATTTRWVTDAVIPFLPRIWSTAS